MKTILVTGANGQVGSELRELATQYPNFRFLLANRAALDITSEQSVNDFFEKHFIHYLINCAAYTAVDKAESEIKQAEAANVHALSFLAKACQKQGATLLHLSTDYVYHGSSNAPFKEDDVTNPSSVYAKTKLEGEKLALAKNEQTLIIRTSWVYSVFGNNFVKTMLRLGASRDSLNVVFDQIGTPTNAADLAKALLHIIQQLESGTKASGIFHYSNEGVTSWYDFAKAIFELAQLDCKVFPIESKDYPTPAARPHFSLMNKGKIKEVFGLEIPHWRDSLAKVISNL